MHRFLILLTLLSAFSFKLNNFSITSLNRSGARSLKGTIALGMGNVSTDVVISDIKGTVYRDGVALVTGKADDLEVPAGNSTVTLSGVATVSQGSSVWIAMFAALSDINSLKADVTCTVTDKATGKSSQVEKKGVTLANYLKTSK